MENYHGRVGTINPSTTLKQSPVAFTHLGEWRAHRDQGGTGKNGNETGKKSDGDQQRIQLSIAAGKSAVLIQFCIVPGLEKYCGGCRLSVGQLQDAAIETDHRSSLDLL